MFLILSQLTGIYLFSFLPSSLLNDYCLDIKGMK